MTVPEEAANGPLRVLVVDGSPVGGGRTRVALDAVASPAAAAGAEVQTVSLSDEEAAGIDATVRAIEGADAFVLGSPVYRAAAASPLKRLLDVIPRANDESRASPLAGKAVAIVHTGASLHHFLALDGLRDVLAGFFAAHVLPPGLYVPREGFDDDGLLAPYSEQALGQGRALVELAGFLKISTSLRALRPQA